MRVLLVGPHHDGGSLPPYLDSLAEGLREHGVTVDRLGSDSVPLDTTTFEFWSKERIVATVKDIADGADLDRYDLLSMHFGDLEIDQLLPMCWADRPHPPVVYHVHSVAPALFRDFLPDEGWATAIDDAIRGFDGYVYNGSGARDRLADLVPRQAPATIAWLPTTIPAGTAPEPTPALGRALDVATGVPVISLYGYPAPWKDAETFTAALGLMTVPARVVLVGEYWSFPGLTGVELSDAVDTPVRVGAVELVVVPDYLGPAARLALVRGSRCGVFPYRPHASFAGSGAVADYLGYGVPVVATHVDNMAEVVGGGGVMVPAGDAQALAVALDEMASNTTMVARLAQVAKARAPMFTAARHAQRCLEVYRRVLDRRADALTGP
jgi:glycosyltransferase involved in cell wall biosynthesis